MKYIILPAFMIVSLQLHAQTIQLIKDVAPGNGDFYVGDLTQVGNIIFFAGTGDIYNGSELWRTDGTEAGTFQVKEINPGAGGIYPAVGTMPSFTDVNGTLFFLADDGTHGYELWRSDGTDAGTYLVKDINPGSPGIVPLYKYEYFTILNNILYFNADDGTHGYELWRSDGTESGTYMVKDIIPGAGDSEPLYTTAAAGLIYFRCYNSNYEIELWKSDGTESGTVMLKQTTMLSFDPLRSNFFVEYNGYVYFAAGPDISDIELWRTDGTTPGTALFKELDSSDESDPRGLTVLNGKLIFSADSYEGNFLYVSDGTVNGTVPLKDSDGNPFEVSFMYAGTLDFLVSGNKLYFSSSVNNDAGIWVTDGTDAGTFKLAQQPYRVVIFGTNQTAAAVNNGIVFKGYDDNNGCTPLYQTNGTVAGTGKSFSCNTLEQPNSIISLNGKAIVYGKNDTYGYELWLVDPELPTGISDPESSMLNVFPNPSSSGVFQFSIPESNNTTTLQVNDVLGRRISVAGTTTLSNPSNLYSIDLSSFPKGIYFLEISNPEQRMISKLIYE